LDILHDSKRGGRVRDRIKAVLLCSEGWPTQMIAQALRYHETTIIRHINDYIEKDKLKPENGGSQGYLSVVQSKALYEHLHEHTYRYAYQIAHYIEETFNVCFSISGLNK
jgi:transposase